MSRAAQNSDTFVVTRNLSWDAFEAYLAERGDVSRPRVSYLEGTLQIMSPSYDHEAISQRLARLIEAYLEHAGIYFDGAGAWLLKSETERAGLEPDQCYLLRDIDKERPDLALEVVWTSGSINKLKIYERLGVPEVWFWINEAITVYVLTNSGYRAQSSSAVVPGFPFELVPEILALPSLSDVNKLVRERFPPK